MSREAHVRFWESAGVRFPRATHLPVYRQQDLFAGSGWTPARSTLLNILVAAAFVIRPLVEHIKRAVLADDIIGTDETRVTLLLPATIPKPQPNDPKSQRIHEVSSEAAAAGRRSVSARMWAYRSVTTPLNLFDFTVSRHRDGPDLMLADFCGTLIADCYTVCLRQACMTRFEHPGTVGCQRLMAWRTADAIHDDKGSSRRARGTSPTV